MATERDYVSHLLALRRAETEMSLERQGYQATVEKDTSGQRVDLFATKDGKTILYEFKVAANLQRDSEQIQRLRVIAAEKRHEFKLVVVAPPKRTLAEVEGLEQALLSFFVHHPVPDELESLASAVFIEDVSDPDISELEVHKDEITAAGSGLIGVRLEYGGGEERDGVTSEDTFPFSFRVNLDRNLDVVSAIEFKVNTSSFYE